MPLNEPWHQMQDPEAAAGELVATSDRFRDSYGRRRCEAVLNWQLYEGFKVGEDIPDDLGDEGRGIFPDEPIEQRIHFCADVVDTLVAKIASVEQPKPAIVVTDGSWERKRQAEISGRFISGQMDLPQGKFRNHADLYAHALRLALAATGTTAVRYYSDALMGKICCELHDTLSMWQDSGGQSYDSPLSMGCVTYHDPIKLACRYPEHEEAIMASIVGSESDVHLELFDRDYDKIRDDIRRVRVVEGWRFKYRDKPGVHTIALGGGGGSATSERKSRLLDTKPYDYEDSPFVMVGGIRNLTGHWHRSLTHTIATPILRVHEMLNSLDKTERLTPKAIVWYDSDFTDEDDIEKRDDTIYLPMPGLSKGAKPQYEAPRLFDPSVMEFLNLYRQAIYDTSGVSQMHTAGTREKGLTSGVALRIVKQLINERFAPIQRAFVHASVIEASRKIIRCAREVWEENKKFKSIWKGDEITSEIDAKVLRVLDDHPYEVSMHAVSEKKDTPEDRASWAQELVSMGIISGESYVEALRHFDTVGETATSQAQRRLIEKQIQKWLYSDADEMLEPGFYRPPLRSMDPWSAAVQVNRAYLRAEADEVEGTRLRFFSDYLAQLQNFIQKQLETQSSLAGNRGLPGGIVQGAQLGGQGTSAPLQTQPAPMSANPAATVAA